ncbi:MAG: hypothetical protein ACOCRO_03335 [Halanaerobiales bacterium]
MDIKTVIARIDEEKHIEFKTKLLIERMNIQEFIETAIDKYLKEEVWLLDKIKYYYNRDKMGQVLQVQAFGIEEVFDTINKDNCHSSILEARSDGLRKLRDIKEIHKKIELRLADLNELKKQRKAVRSKKPIIGEKNDEEMKKYLEIGNMTDLKTIYPDGLENVTGGRGRYDKFIDSFNFEVLLYKDTYLEGYEPAWGYIYLLMKYKDKYGVIMMGWSDDERNDFLTRIKYYDDLEWKRYEILRNITWKDTLDDMLNYLTKKEWLEEDEKIYKLKYALIQDEEGVNKFVKDAIEVLKEEKDKNQQ